jgi:putative protease
VRYTAETREEAMPEDKIGEVTNFFVKPMVAAIKLSATLTVGDTIHVKGNSTDLTCQVGSMQIDRAAVESAEAGAEVGIQLPERARAGDEVFKVTD